VTKVLKVFKVRKVNLKVIKVFKVSKVPQGPTGPKFICKQVPKGGIGDVGGPQGEPGVAATKFQLVKNHY
jgi:hypothetical protein